MALLSKEQILSAVDIETKEVDVPEWGGAVLIKMMSGTERDEFELLLTKGGTQNIKNFRAKYLAKCLVGEDGELLFSEKEIPALGKKSVRALERVYNEALTLNAFSGDDVEALEKN